MVEYYPSVPRIHSHELGPIGEAMKLRVQQLELTQKMMKERGIGRDTMLQIMGGRGPVKKSTVERFIGLLNDNPTNPGDQPFPNGSIKELLQWYDAEGGTVRAEIAARPARAPRNGMKQLLAAGPRPPGEESPGGERNR